MTTTRPGPSALAWGLLAPALCCVAAFVIAPIACVGLYSFWSHLPTGAVRTSFTLANWRELFTDPFYGEILLKTIRMSAVSTVACAVLGYGPAYYLTLQPARRRNAFVLLLFLPSWISYVVRSMSWLHVLGPNGLANTALVGAGIVSSPLPLLYNDFSVYVGIVQYLLPLMIINIYIGLQLIDRNVLDAARTLGASGIQAFWAVTFPLALPGLSAGCLLSFILAMGAYITPMVLGGPGTTYYANIVYDTVINQQDWPLGATLSLVVVFFLALSLYGYARLAGFATMFREARP